MSAGKRVAVLLTYIGGTEGRLQMEIVRKKLSRSLLLELADRYEQGAKELREIAGVKDDRNSE